ncbi:MAG TPA: PQQ-dependent sugar dehydrogenase, partial [Chitinophagaceae bacterium]
SVPWPQGGFAGLVLHPKFMDPTTPKNYVYISYVHQYNSSSGTTNGGHFFTNYLVRFTYNTVTGHLEDPKAMCDTLPGSSDHNSQRVIIAPVGGTDYLFYAQGDMGAGQLANQFRTNKAQDSTSYEGKILRFNLEPDADVDSTDMWIPDDNPYNKPAKQSAVWAMGIRNNQGFAYNPTTGVLYGASHGPYSDDEINIIQRYKNYGHPRIIGYAADGNYNGTTGPGLSTSVSAGAPFTASSGNSTIAPVGDEAANAATINASGFAPYQDPIYSAYPGPVSGATSVASIWATNTPTNGSWPSEAWSGLDVYTNSVIPGWKNSLVVAGLKWGRVLRFALNASGTAIVPTNGADTVTYFQGPNRFRDLAFDANGKDIYVSMEGSTGVGPNGSATVAPTVSACTNCIIKYTFLGYSPDATGKSTIPSYVSVSDPAGNTIVNGNTVTIDNTNNNLWVPITGSDGNIMAEINANGNNLGAVTTKVYKNTSAIRNANGVRYLDRNYTITPTTQPGTPVSIRLYFSKAEFDALDADPMSGVTAITDMKVLKNQDAAEAAISSNTTLVTPTYQGAQGAAGYVLQADISSFSSFFFASSNIILPLKLVSFKAALRNNAGDLQWVTTNEVSTANFILERSIDGQSFQKIATVPAKGNINLNNYSYTDNDAAYQSSNTIYYRLKMVDDDGSYIYSNVVTITLPLVAGKVVVFPNPASNQVMITVALQSDSKVKWHLSDNAGHIVNHNSAQLRKGKNSFSIDVSNLSSGIYFFRITGGGIDEKIKLEKL